MLNIFEKVGQEVIGATGEAVQPSMYYSLGIRRLFIRILLLIYYLSLGR